MWYWPDNLEEILQANTKLGKKLMVKCLSEHNLPLKLQISCKIILYFNVFVKRIKDLPDPGNSHLVFRVMIVKSVDNHQTHHDLSLGPLLLWDQVATIPNITDS